MENKYKELLKVGQVYKSYRQVCEALGEKVKAGDSKYSQLKEWERYFKYDKDGNKFIITDIFDEPSEKVDLRKEGNSKIKYIEHIEKLILDLLLQKEDEGYTVFLSKNKMLQTLKMINENYSKGKYEVNKLSHYTKVPINEINDFYSSSDGMLQRHLEKALNNLRDKSLIIWKPSLTVAFIETNAIYNSTHDLMAVRKEDVTQYGDVKVTFESQEIVTKLVHRKATPYEESLILDAEFDIRQNYGCDSISEIYKKGLNDRFYKEVNEFLEFNHNIHRYYNSYEISFNPEQLQNKIDIIEKLEHKEREKTQIQLNTEIKDQITFNTYNRHENAKGKVHKHKKYEVRASEQYIQDNGRLINKLIDIDAELI
ncbi:hypothetical protein D7X33_27380, partial [Butyricicoccus sp. 1XD8-22]